MIDRSRAADLITALAKLADPGEPRLLRAAAATLFSHRLKRLKTAEPQRAPRASDLALITVYGAVLLACVLETVAHTPSCSTIAM